MKGNFKRLLKTCRCGQTKIVISFPNLRLHAFVFVKSEVFTHILIYVWMRFSFLSWGRPNFLVLFFDRDLGFIPLVMSLRLRCLNSLNLLRIVSNVNSGGSCNVSLCCYRALIRSMLDYGCVAYGSPHRSYLLKLDLMHHHGVRLCLRVFRTSPVESLLGRLRTPFSVAL